MKIGSWLPKLILTLVMATVTMACFGLDMFWQAVNVQNTYKTVEAALATESFSQPRTTAPGRTIAPGGAVRISGTTATPGLFLAPTDIPIMPESGELSGSASQVSYTARAAYPAVVEFYRREMLKHNWKAISSPQPTQETTVLNFEKSGRKAIVTINRQDNQALVQVVVTR